MCTTCLQLFLLLSAPALQLLFLLHFDLSQQFSHVVVLLLREGQRSLHHLQPAQHQVVTVAARASQHIKATARLQGRPRTPGFTWCMFSPTTWAITTSKPRTRFVQIWFSDKIEFKFVDFVDTNNINKLLKTMEYVDACYFFSCENSCKRHHSMIEWITDRNP